MKQPYSHHLGENPKRRGLLIITLTAIMSLFASVLYLVSTPAVSAATGLYGSWNRAEKTGYKIAYFPWDNSSQTPGDHIDLVTGWLNKETQEVWGHPADVTTPASTEYDAPLTITEGGIYSGNWESLDPNVPAVRVRTDEPVTIENCNLRGRGNLIDAGPSGGDVTVHSKITVRNCNGYALNPNEVGRPPGNFLEVVFFHSVVVENNYMEGTAGMFLNGWKGDAAAGHTVKILRNRARNIDGRLSDGNGGFLSGRDDYRRVSFAGLNGAKGIEGVEIAWNEVINEPGQSRVEDNINIHNSSGTEDSPILIHNNFIRGAYPAEITMQGYNGGGIMVADGNAQTREDATAFVHAYDNQVVSSANYGIAIASGHDNAFYNNRVVRSGFTSDGTRIAHHFTGIYVWDCCYGQTNLNPPVFYNNVAYDNFIGYAWIKENDEYIRSDTHLPDCAVDGGNESRCTNNQSMPDPITADTEAAEYTWWQDKLTTAGISIGPGGGGSPVTQGNGVYLPLMQR